MNLKKRRVVITGVGAISPLGCDVNSMWGNLIDCKSGVKLIDSFDTSHLPVKIAGIVPKGEFGFNPDLYTTPFEQRKMDQFILYAIAASSQAYIDAGFATLTEEDRQNAAVVIGSALGGFSKLYESAISLHDVGYRRISPFFIPSVLTNLAAGHVAIKHGFMAENYSMVSACASGTCCIGEAFRLIQGGHIDFALTGGADAGVCELGIAGFSATKSLSTKFNNTPELASRPWDKERDGFIIGEGAGILALEELESAKKRGREIYGEIIGFGASCDAHHITTPLNDGAGIALAMKKAISNANIELNKIDYINVHGASTIAGDLAEIIAIKKVFGDCAYKLNVSSTKSAMGSLLGAAGGVESIICLLAMKNNIVPATLNLETPDEGCDLNLTPNIPQERKLSCVMKNSFGFWGGKYKLDL